MPWARIDDAFDDHPKVLAVLEHEQGGAAIGLWTLCLTWAHRNTLRRGKTPGVVPASLPRRYLGPGARELAALLVKEGLWDAQAEGDGWTIHDFDQYLPTEKTSAARAEAGRKGAQSRWGKPKPDGKESGSDGKELDSDGKLPSGGHDVDSNPEANDGSRAPARRAISKEIAPRDPSPVPPTAGKSQTTGRRKAAPVPEHAGSVVGAYVDGAVAAGHPRPDESLRKRVGKQAGQMLAKGDVTLDQLLAAAEHMGAGGWADLAIQVQRDAAAKTAAPNGAASTGAQRAQQAINAGDQLQQLLDEGRYSA